MPRVESRLITKKMTYHANMTEMNHLGAALVTKPHVFESTFNKLFTAQQYSGNPLTAILTGQAREETIEKTDWEWELRGANSRPLIVVQRVEPDSNTTPGKYNETFDIAYDKEWWLAGDIVHPGNGDKKYQCRIQVARGRKGVGYVYTLKPMSDDDNFFIPNKYIQPGATWAKLYSQYEEAAEQSGSTQYNSGIGLRNHMSRFRKMYQVTGDAAQEVLKVEIPTSDGKMVNSWIKYAEVEYWQQWYKELERADWYSRDTANVKGANGRPVRTGPGVQQQLEDSHVHRFSVLTARLIEEYLMDIFYSRVKPGVGRHIKGFTGEYGMLNFHRAIMALAEKRGFLQVVDDMYIQKTNSPLHDNALSYGYQYTKYKMANGSTLELVHNPLYDDREINMEIDEMTGFPTESQRITFLDFSGEGSTSNVRILNKKDSFKVGYTAGLQNPFGPNNNKLMSHSGDYYTMHCQKQRGIHIEDVTRCGELILDRN